MSDVRKSLARIIEKYCDQELIQFYPDYSGRNMYGRECVGYVTERGVVREILSLIQYISSNSEDEEYCLSDYIEELKGCKVDDMGMDTILYFPNIKLKEEK